MGKPEKVVIVCQCHSLGGTVVGKLVDRIIPTLPHIKKGVTVKSELVGELIGLLRKAESGGTLASGEPWKLEPTMILPNECRGALYQTLVPRARPQHIVSDTVRLDF